MDATERGGSVLLHTVARLLHDTGRPNDGRLLLEEGLAVRRETLGPDHPDTLSTTNILVRFSESIGWLLREQGWVDDANALEEEARSRAGEIQQPVASAVSLDALLLPASRESSAAGAAQPLLAEARLVHVAVASSVGYADLSSPVLARLREWLTGAARAAFAKMDVAERGASVMLHTVARLLYDAGRPAEALALLEEGLAVRRETLGAAHPDTLATTNHVRELRDVLGDLGVHD